MSNTYKAGVGAVGHVGMSIKYWAHSSWSMTSYRTGLAPRGVEDNTLPSVSAEPCGSVPERDRGCIARVLRLGVRERSRSLGEM